MERHNLSGNNQVTNNQINRRSFLKNVTAFLSGLVLMNVPLKNVLASII